MMTRRIEDLNTLMTEPDPDSLAELYHENSKLRRVNFRQYGEFISRLTTVPNIAEKMARSYKMYPASPRYAFPLEPSLHRTSGLSIEEVIESRRTVRRFSGESITVEQLSILLHFSYGITCTISNPSLPEEHLSMRAAPSAGALYPLEIYLVAWNITGLESGLYHYCVVTHSLEQLKAGDFAKLACEYTMADDISNTASALFVVTAIFQRTMLKYQDRGYRFVLLEAGHLAQNMCLMAAAMNLGILPIGAFLDDELNRLLGLDGVNETAVYPLAVGRVGTK